MTESKQNSRDLALLALTMLAEMFTYSQLNKKLESDDQRVFDSLVALWSKGLEGLSREQVERGLKAVLESGTKFEPSLPDFRQMCKGSTKAYHKMYAGLPRPRANKAVRVGQITKMREILAKTAE